MSGAFFLVAPESQADWSLLPDPKREEVDPARKDARFAKLDRASKLLVLGALRSLEGLTIEPVRTGLVLASFTGCLAADERFDETRRKPEGASPALFPATLPTAPAAEVSIRLGLGGPIFSVRSRLETALALAARIVLGGGADRVLACGLEVAAGGASSLLGHRGPFRESVCAVVVDRARAGRFRVPLADTLDLPRSSLLANERAQRLVETLNSPG